MISIEITIKKLKSDWIGRVSVTLVITDINSKYYLYASRETLRTYYCLLKWIGRKRINSSELDAT